MIKKDLRGKPPLTPESRASLLATLRRMTIIE